MSARSSTRTELRRRAAAGHLAAASLALFATVGCGKSNPGERDPLRVAAASDLSQAFVAVGAAYEKDTGRKVTFSFGSTGQFAKQLVEGAPFDVFAAANVKFVDEVLAGGRCIAETKQLYARGRIVLVVRKGLDAPKTVAGLTDEKFVKIAIANPEHAPYGTAAKQAMEKAGVWDQLKGRLVFGENILQTRQFVESGNADVAVVALALALGGESKFEVIPAEEHAPLDQAMVVCSTPERVEEAKAFADWVSSEKGRPIMKGFGFLLPGESLAKAP